MKTFSISLITMLLAAAVYGCKTADSQLQEDLYFPSDGVNGSVGYLTWVVGDKPAPGQPDNRHICRAACEKDPAAMAGEQGKDKLNDVRQSCSPDSARSIAFTKLNEPNSGYGTAVSMADSNQPIQRNGIGSDNQELADLIRIWQDRGNSFGNSGVTSINTKGDNATEINIKREQVIQALFSDEALVYLPEAVAQAQLQHNMQQDNQIKSGIKPDTARVPFEIPAGTPRRIDSCFAGAVAGSPTETKEEAKSAPATGDAREIGPNAFRLEDQLAYDYLKAKISQCLTQKPVVEITFPHKDLTLKVLHLRHMSFSRIKQIEPPTEADLTLMYLRPGENYGVEVESAGPFKVSYQHKGFHDIVRIWGGLYNHNGFAVNPVQCGPQDADGWITLKANFKAGRVADLKVFDVAKVRFKAAAEGSGGSIEFQDVGAWEQKL